MTSPRKAQFVGLCAACMRKVAVDARDHLWEHGYQRPGDGAIHDTCLGTGRLPHEISPDLAKEVLSLTMKDLAQRQKRLSLLISGKLGELTVGEPPRRITPSDRSWSDELERETSRTSASITALRARLEQLDQMVSNWQPKPFEEREQYEARERQAKQASKAERDARAQQAQVELKRRKADLPRRGWERVTGLLELSMDRPLFEALAKQAAEPGKRFVPTARYDVLQEAGKAARTASPWLSSSHISREINPLLLRGVYEETQWWPDTLWRVRSWDVSSGDLPLEAVDKYLSEAAGQTNQATGHSHESPIAAPVEWRRLFAKHLAAAMERDHLTDQRREQVWSAARLLKVTPPDRAEQPPAESSPMFEQGSFWDRAR